MNAWPETLPQLSDSEGYSENLGDGRAMFENELGDVSGRPRVSYVPDQLTLVFVMTHTQYELMTNWVRNVIRRTLPFTIPSQRGTGTWVVKLGRGMPQAVAWTPELLKVTLELVRLPQ